MGWQFVSEEEGDKALEEGEFYATITIPDNFSKDITSLVSSEVKKGEIIYRVNEKINAIAPKLTSKGATGVQENINKTIVETVSGILFESGKELGLEIQETVLPQLSTVYHQLEELISKFDEMNELVQTAHQGGIQLKDLIASIQTDLPLISETIVSAQATVTSLESFIETSKSSLADFMPTLKEDISLVQSIANDLLTYTEELKQAIVNGTEQAPQLVSNLISKIESTQGLIQSLVKILETFNKFPAGKLDEVINQLTDTSNQLDQAKVVLNQVYESLLAGGEPDLTALNKVETLLTNVSTTMEGIYNRFDTAITPALNEVINEAYVTADHVLTVLKEAQSKLPEVESLLNTAYEGADKGIDAIEYVNSSLPKAEDKVKEITSKLVTLIIVKI